MTHSFNSKVYFYLLLKKGDTPKGIWSFLGHYMQNKFGRIIKSENNPLGRQELAEHRISVQNAPTEEFNCNAIFSGQKEPCEENVAVAEYCGLISLRGKGKNGGNGP